MINVEGDSYGAGVVQHLSRHTLHELDAEANAAEDGNAADDQTELADKPPQYGIPSKPIPGVQPNGTFNYNAAIAWPHDSKDVANSHVNPAYEFGDVEHQTKFWVSSLQDRINVGLASL